METTTTHKERRAGPRDWLQPADCVTAACAPWNIVVVLPQLHILFFSLLLSCKESSSSSSSSCCCCCCCCSVFRDSSCCAYSTKNPVVRYWRNPIVGYTERASRRLWLWISSKTPCCCCCIPPVSSSSSSISPASPETHANKQTKKSSVFSSASPPNPNFGAHSKGVGWLQVLIQVPRSNGQVLI